MEIIIDKMNKVKVTEDGSYYFCRIIEKNKSKNWADCIFGSKKIKGEEEIIKKAKAMIKAKKRFIKDYPEHK